MSAAEKLQRLDERWQLASTQDAVSRLFSEFEPVLPQIVAVVEAAESSDRAFRPRGVELNLLRDALVALNEALA